MCCRKLWDVRVCRSEALDRKGMRMCFDLTDLPAGRLYFRMHQKQLHVLVLLRLLCRFLFTRKKRFRCSACTGLGSEREYSS